MVFELIQQARLFVNKSESSAGKPSCIAVSTKLICGGSPDQQHLIHLHSIGVVICQAGVYDFMIAIISSFVSQRIQVAVISCVSAT